MPPRRRAVLLCGTARATLAAVARELARSDLSLVLQATPAELAATRRLVGAMTRGGAAATAIAGTLSGAVENGRMIAAAWAATRGIDTVVICAGAPPATDSIEPRLDAWQAAIGAGLRAPFFVAQQSVRRLARRRGGRLIVAIDAPARGGGPIAAVIRAGLLCMVEGLTKAVPAGIAVSAVVGARARGTRETSREIARGVDMFVTGEKPFRGTVLELGEPSPRG